MTSFPSSTPNVSAHDAAPARPRVFVHVLMWCVAVVVLGTLSATAMRTWASTAVADNFDKKQGIKPVNQAQSAHFSDKSASSQGDMMAHTCAACHGTNGRLGDERFMPLAGMPVAQFVQTMIDFRENKRPATLMGHVARGFSDEDLHAMAVFFAAQPPHPIQGGVQ